MDLCELRLFIIINVIIAVGLFNLIHTVNMKAGYLIRRFDIWRREFRILITFLNRIIQSELSAFSIVIYMISVFLLL